MSVACCCHIFAHRGANREAAENTRAAFKKALNYAIDGIETDVQLSRDEIPVLWHDRHLEKLGFNNQSIDDFDYRDLAEMNFLKSDLEFEGVLSLEEFLISYRGRTRLQIEIKNRDTESVLRHQVKIRKCIDLIGAKPDEDIFISSFHLASMVYAHHYAPDFPIYFALKDTQTRLELEQLLHGYRFFKGFCLPVSLLNQAIVNLLRAEGKAIAVYTCNSEAEISKALQLAVDVLITDDPKKALLMRAQYIKADAKSCL
jgi:glycerophosphoryl diester phosphodiesterase